MWVAVPSVSTECSSYVNKFCMRKLIKTFFGVGALLLTLPTAWGYSTGGPSIGGDGWQVTTIGYNLPGDIMAPKNISEEYRRVTPVMYYAADSTFLGYFGLAGMTNIDSAFAVMNSIGKVSSYSKDLSEFPYESQQFNYTAAALGLTDLKSTTLGLLVEQMGLAEPDRYVWTLHDRWTTPFPGAKCPDDVLYLVVQRNYDIQDSPLTQVQYSPYINGTLYTFSITEGCNTPIPPQAVTVPFSPDPFASTFTAVANAAVLPGGFYTGLTRDDVGGLRFLLNSNNINFEATAPSGSLLVTTNVQAPSLFTTLPIALLLSQSVTNDPATLQTNYPGLTINSVATNYVNRVFTNITAYFTNLPGPYTNTLPPYANGATVYASNGIVPFTNWSPVQYGDPPNVLSTFPLTPLLVFAPYIDPATLIGFYPGLMLGPVKTNFLAVEITTNVVPYYTNLSVLPVYSNLISGSLPQVTYLTNIYFFTNQPGPTVINYDTTQPPTFISTLDLATFVDRARTNDPATLLAFYPGLQILRTNTSVDYIWVTNYISYLTNLTGAPYQGAPKLVTVVDSYQPQWVTTWKYTFGNVFTNHFYTNRFVTVQSIWITNLIGAPYGSPFVARTNTVTYKTNMISGDFFLIPTNWCGFDLIRALPLGSPPYLTGLTNVIIYPGYNTNGVTGTNNLTGGNAYGLSQNTYDIYTNYNYAVYPGICEPVIYFANNYETNIVRKYDYEFLNVVTNHYYSNSLVTSFATNIFATPGGSPEALTTNVTQTQFYTNLPSGDFYIVPSTWCGYQITPLLTNYIYPTNIVFTNNFVNAPGNQNLQFSYLWYLSYTNYLYSLRPGVCEPALAFSTNYTTNIVSQYTYNFGGIVINQYYTNAPITVVTTNLAIWTNGLVGTLTNIVSTNVYPAHIGGEFYVVPPAFCDFRILSTQVVSVVTTTNTFSSTNLAGVVNLGQNYSETSTYRDTNTTFVVQLATCDTVAAPSALRQGIEHVEFVRANFDSLLGQFFVPITNTYAMVKITNSQPITEYYQRIVTAPDILLQARDTASPNSPQIGAGGVGRGIQFDTSTAGPGLSGPGTIIPRTVFTYDKVGTVYENGSLNQFTLTTNSFLNESTQIPVWAWGSFDGSTNDPVVYPNGTSLANMVNQLFIQVTPAAVADGYVGAPYGAVTFTATGGQSPYTWAMPGISTLVPGLNFNTNTATLSGTPSVAGTFTLSLQVTDSANRAVNLNYSLIIH